MSRDTFGRFVPNRIAAGCPDCDADTGLVDAGGGLYVLTIRHDDTCPTLRRMQQKGSQR